MLSPMKSRIRSFVVACTAAKSIHCIIVGQPKLPTAGHHQFAIVTSQKSGAWQSMTEVRKLGAVRFQSTVHVTSWNPLCKTAW